jgi:hypothetical protein
MADGSCTCVNPCAGSYIPGDYSSWCEIAKIYRDKGLGVHGCESQADGRHHTKTGIPFIPKVTYFARGCVQPTTQ